MGANRGRKAVNKALEKKKEKVVEKCVVPDCAVQKSVAAKLKCKTCGGHFHLVCSNDQEVGIECKRCGPQPGKCVYCKKVASILTCSVCGGGFHPSCQRKNRATDCGLITLQTNCGRKVCAEESEDRVEEAEGGSAVETLASNQATLALAGLAKQEKNSRRKSLDWNTSAPKTSDAGEHIFERSPIIELVMCFVISFCFSRYL